MNAIETIKQIFINFWSLLRSPRFKAFYWSTGIAAVIGFLGLITDIIPQLGLSELGAALLVAGIAQVTKALTNLMKGKEMGFAAKN